MPFWAESDLLVCGGAHIDALLFAAVHGDSFRTHLPPSISRRGPSTINTAANDMAYESVGHEVEDMKRGFPDWQKNQFYTDGAELPASLVASRAPSERCTSNTP